MPMTIEEINSIASRAADAVLSGDISQKEVPVENIPTTPPAIEQPAAPAQCEEGDPGCPVINKDSPKCPVELQPMAVWVLGETPGTCRPCTLGPVIQWYYQELKERGYEDEAQSLEEEANVLEDDNMEQMVAICSDLDEIKKAAPEDLRKRLEEFDCSVQAFNPDETFEDVPPAD